MMNKINNDLNIPCNYFQTYFLCLLMTRLLLFHTIYYETIHYGNKKHIFNY